MIQYSKVSHHWHKSSKECNEAVHLQDDPNDGPAEQQDENPAQEAGRTFQPLHLAKEAPSSFKTNAEHKTSNAEEVSNGKDAADQAKQSWFCSKTVGLVSEGA